MPRLLCCATVHLICWLASCHLASGSRKSSTHKVAVVTPDNSSTGQSQPKDSKTAKEVELEEWDRKYAKGRCCHSQQKSKDVFKWFYWEEADGTIKKNNHAAVFSGCPGKWSTKADHECVPGTDVQNQYGFKEDTDWVLCCKKGASKTYQYFTGSSCRKKEKRWHNGNLKCQNYDECVEHDGVDEADFQCDSGFERHVNAATNEHCKATSTGMTWAECAGYFSDCTKSMCFVDSFAKRSDCRQHCAGWEESSAANREQIVAKAEYGGMEADNSSYMVLGIGFGAIVLFVCAGGAYMKFGPSGDDEVGAKAEGPEGKGQGKGKGPGKGKDGKGDPSNPSFNMGMGAPGYGGAAPGSGGYAQQPGAGYAQQPGAPPQQMGYIAY